MYFRVLLCIADVGGQQGRHKADLQSAHFSNSASAASVAAPAAAPPLVCPPACPLVGSALLSLTFDAFAAVQRRASSTAARRHRLMQRIFFMMEGAECLSH